MSDNINTASMLRVGAILDGKYRIERYLSSGGFGNTYAAINEFGEQVAVKEFFLKGINQRKANNTTVSVSNTENRAQFDQQRAKFKKFTYVSQGVKSLSKGRQHPVMWGNFDDNFVMIDWRQ